MPLDASTLRRLATTDVIVVEPFYEGTLAAEVTAALRDRPVRLTSIGVPRRADHRYGTPADHDRANGLDAAGIRARLLEALPALAWRAA